MTACRRWLFYLLLAGDFLVQPVELKDVAKQHTFCKQNLFKWNRYFEKFSSQDMLKNLRKKIENYLEKIKSW